MRINKCIRIGRLELYVGYPSIWWRVPVWRVDRTSLGGYDIMLGRLQVIADWLASKRERERQRVEWLAKVHAQVDAAELASWPVRAAP